MSRAIVLCGWGMGLALLAGAWTAAQEPLALEFEPFTRQDEPPRGWKPLTFPRVPNHTRYTVIREGDAFVLRAESQAAASGLIRELDLDPRAYPVISWRWKVENLLAKSDARRKEGDDYPARIYVAFRYDPEAANLWERTMYGTLKLLYGEYPPKAVINYIWDARLPKGTMLDNAYTHRAKMVVVESGPERVGRWAHVERNLVEDYRRLFGGEPSRIMGIAVMTDTDNTGESAVAYYADVVLRASLAGGG